jgi:hypothetical protein
MDRLLSQLARNRSVRELVLHDVSRDQLVRRGGIQAALVSILGGDGPALERLTLRGDVPMDDELAAALGNSGLTHLTLNLVDITDGQMALLARGIGRRDSPLVELRITGGRYGDAGVRALAHGMAAGSGALRHLDMLQNDRLSRQSVDALQERVATDGTGGLTSFRLDLGRRAGPRRPEMRRTGLSPMAGLRRLDGAVYETWSFARYPGARRIHTMATGGWQPWQFFAAQQEARRWSNVGYRQPLTVQRPGERYPRVRMVNSLVRLQPVFPLQSLRSTAPYIAASAISARWTTGRWRHLLSGLKRLRP